LVLRVQVRRFVCATAACPRRIFAEPFPEAAAPRARLTHHLRSALQAVGLAGGGQAGARLARHLGMPAHGKTVLHIVRATPVPSVEPPRVVGIAEWASLSGHR
jgi:hypothetical protein